MADLIPVKETSGVFASRTGIDYCEHDSFAMRTRHGAGSSFQRSERAGAPARRLTDASLAPVTETDSIRATDRRESRTALIR
jgi:hypothetical protein